MSNRRAGNWAEHIYVESSSKNTFPRWTIQEVLCGQVVAYSGGENPEKPQDEWSLLDEYLRDLEDPANMRLPWCPKCIKKITPLLRLAHTEL